MTISEILLRSGYGHRPEGDNGKHAIFSFNTMEVVGVFSAHDVLRALGLSD